MINIFDYVNFINLDEVKKISRQYNNVGMIPKVIYYYGNIIVKNKYLDNIVSIKKFIKKNSDWKIHMINVYECADEFPEIKDIVKFLLKKRFFGYLSDIMRLLYLHKFGGMWIDTDVELHKPVEDCYLKSDYILCNENFINVDETFKERIDSGIMLFKPKSELCGLFLKHIIEEYTEFIKKDVYNPDVYYSVMLPDILKKSIEKNGIKIMPLNKIDEKYVTNTNTLKNNLYLLYGDYFSRDKIYKEDISEDKYYATHKFFNSWVNNWKR